MKTTLMGLAAVAGLVLFGATNSAEANHRCGYGGGYYGGGYGVGYGGYYQPSYGYGAYPRSYGYYPNRGFYGYGRGYYGGRGGVSVNTGNFGFRYRW